MSFQTVRRELAKKANISTKDAEDYIKLLLKKNQYSIVQAVINWGKNQCSLGKSFLGDTGPKLTKAGCSNLKSVGWKNWQDKLNQLVDRDKKE